MIYIVIGASHSGKSSFVYNSFVKNRNAIYYKDILGITETDTAYLIGNFLTTNRRKGTDLIARQDVGKLYDQVVKLTEKNKNKDIILEGAKTCSRPFINNLLQSNYDIIIYFIQCPLELSIERNNNFISSNTNLRALKTAYSLALNFFNTYKNTIPTYVIDSSAITDFTTFDITFPSTLYTEKNKVLF